VCGGVCALTPPHAVYIFSGWHVRYYGILMNDSRSDHLSSPRCAPLHGRGTVRILKDPHDNLSGLARWAGVVVGVRYRRAHGREGAVRWRAETVGGCVRAVRLTELAKGREVFTWIVPAREESALGANAGELVLPVGLED
jgi:hypothetical protein